MIFCFFHWSISYAIKYFFAEIMGVSVIKSYQIIDLILYFCYNMYMI